MNLHKKLLLLISGFVSLAIGVALLLAAVVTNIQVKRFASATTDSITKSLASELSRLESSLASQARLLSDRPGTASVYITDSATISDHLNEQQKLLNADWVSMADADGKVIGTSANSPLKVGESSRKSSLFQKTKSKHESSGMVNVGNNISVVAARSIRVGEYTKAILFLGENIDEGLLKRINQHDGAVISVQCPSGTLVSSDQIPKSNSSLITQTQSLDFDSLKGQSIGQLNVNVDSSVVAEPFRPVIYSLIGAFLFTTIIAAFGASRLASSVSGPLERLAVVAKELQNGQWPEQLVKYRSDEIGQLESAFDEMASNLKASRERLLKMFDVDPLTELLNYRALRLKISQELQATTVPLHFALLNLDQMERFNQTNGEEAGDELLAAVAKMIQTEFADANALGRLGGDQFGILTSSDNLPELIEKLKNKIERECKISFSAGIYPELSPEDRPDLILVGCEIAVSQVKNSGRGGIRIFDPATLAISESELNHLQQSSYGAVLALAEAVDAKDEYTRGHSKRVAEYSRDLAQQCGLDDGFVKLVYVTGTLHDVGKIGVPDAVLKKTDRLTPEEFETIKLHPALGEKIVNRIPELAETLPGVRHHHERWDGKGYPDQLAGEQIPLLARVLAVADTWDAMTSDRPYRKGMDFDKALNIIRECAGTQLDPELCRIFEQLLLDRNSYQAAA